jgi:hypothetical protein
MKNKKAIFFKLIIFILLITSCGETNKSMVLESPVLKRRKVLVIGIDGCRPDALIAANTPNLDKLMANGTFSLDARNIRTTSSGPGWSSILTGVWQEKHGVTDNSFNGSNFNRYPHFFKLIKDTYPKSRNVSLCEWSEINDKIVGQNADSAINTSNASDTQIKAVAELEVENLTSLFLHFDAPDHAGHSSGFSPLNPHYIDAIEEVDRAIGGIIAAMKRRVNYSNEEWIVVVTTDHGGIDTGHGGDSEQERTIFMIVSGFNVPSKKIIKNTVHSTIPPVSNCLNSNSELLFNRDATVKVLNSDTYNFGTYQDFSIECRFRTKSASDVSIISKKDWNKGSNPGYVFSFKPSTKKFIVNIGDGINRVDIETSVVSDNQWHTASSTFDRNGLVRVYIDGILSNSASISRLGNINNVLPLTFGSDGRGAYKFDGCIAEVRIFNTLLSAEDIAIWRCKSLNNSHSKYSNLVGYWKMTEGSGTIINDSSINNLQGMLENAIWQGSKDNQIIETSDYKDTPRSVDVVSTVLNHLCIPVERSWSLDGKTLIHANCNN